MGYLIHVWKILADDFALSVASFCEGRVLNIVPFEEIFDIMFSLDISAR